MIVTDKWWLVYEGSKYIASGFHTGEIATTKTLEVFDTETEMLARADELNLTIPEMPE